MTSRVEERNKKGAERKLKQRFLGDKCDFIGAVMSPQTVSIKGLPNLSVNVELNKVI